MQAVRFLKHYSSYEKGNVAAFPDELAQILVDAKTAEWADKKQPPKKQITEDMVKKG